MAAAAVFSAVRTLRPPSADWTVMMRLKLESYLTLTLSPWRTATHILASNFRQS